MKQWLSWIDRGFYIDESGLGLVFGMMMVTVVWLFAKNKGFWDFSNKPEGGSELAKVENWQDSELVSFFG